MQLTARNGDVSFTVVARDDQSLIAAVRAEPVDVVLSCFEPLAVSARIARSVNAPVVAMSWSQRTADVLDALRSGVRGLLAKSCEPDQVCEVIHAVRTGHLVYPRGWEHVLLNADGAKAARRRRGDDNPLTHREAEIVHLLLAGLSARQISTRLGIAVQTVKNHMHHILVKLGLSSRAELQAWASDRGWDGLAGTAAATATVTKELTRHAV